MKTLKFGDLVGVYYPTSVYTSRGIIIVALGAPNTEDVGALRNATILNQAGYDIFVPEYYGFSRSIGSFSLYSSLRTLIDSIDIFTLGTCGYDILSGERFSRSYTEIIVLGISYGGGIAASLPKYRNTLRKIGLIFPLLSYVGLGDGKYPEESGEAFLSAILGEYSSLYQSVDVHVWRKYFSGEYRLPIASDDISFLQNRLFYLAHGTLDNSIHYSRTVEFSEKLSALFPENIRPMMNLYEGIGHTTDTLMVASHDFIHWLEDYQNDL